MADTQKLKNFEFGNATDTGRVREHNEDYHAYFESINGHIFIVCDGLGGHAGGATASQLAANAIREFLENHYFDIPQDALKESIRYANQVVYGKALENPEFSGMGTTIAMAIIREDKVFYAHVGDSRIYICSQNKLFRLTRDHSVVQELADRGEITEAEMEFHPRKNEILQAIGVKPDVEISVCSSPVKPANSDILLLCTDGLTGMISDRTIESVLNEDLSIQHKALKLIQLANEAGGHDNITVQLIHFYNTGNRKSEFIHIHTPAKNFPQDKTSENLSPKQLKMRKGIMIGIIAVCILAILYFVWDMFIRSSAPAPLVETRTDDTTKTRTTDTVKKPEQESAPQEAVNKLSDTVYIDYIVKSGDVLGKISNRFHISIELIKRKNNLKNDNINKDQILKIPVRAEYTVKEGDNLDMLAKKYNLKKELVLKANGLTSEKELKAGKNIYIPF